MSDFDDTDEFDDPDEGDENESSVLKDLRKKARAGSAAAAERDALKRELAFTKAGVPDSKAASYFVKAYDGELDPESIRAAAVEAGFLEAAKDTTDEEEDANDRILDASGGVTDDTTPPGYAEELAAAKTPDEALAVIEKYKSPTVST